MGDITLEERTVMETRKRTCLRCAHWRAAGQGVWVHPHCIHAGRDTSLTPEFLTGPESNCDAGYWAGLAPVDVEQDRFDGREMTRRRMRGSMRHLMVRLVVDTLEGGTDGALKGLRTASVNGWCPLWLAAEVVGNLASSSEARLPLIQSSLEQMIESPEMGRQKAQAALRDCWEAEVISSEEAVALSEELKL